MTNTPESEASSQDKTAGKTARVVGTTAGVATLFLLLRLFAVSEWNWEAAADIAETFDFDDALPIVFGTLFSEPTLTGLVLSVLTPISVIGLVWPLITPRVQSLPLLLLPLALSVASVTWFVTFREWWFLALAAVTSAGVIGGRLLWKKGTGRKVIVQVHKRVGTLAVLALLVLAVAVQTPWMSHERITTTGGTVDGYVLGDEPGFLRVLTDDRDVIIFNTSDVKSRELLD